MDNLKNLYKNLLIKFSKLVKHIKNTVKKRYNDYYKKEKVVIKKEVKEIKNLLAKEVKKDENKTGKKSRARSKR